MLLQYFSGTKKMEYKTRQWHEKCFCCCVCKTPIGTKSFIPREQEIYCAGCYEEKFATRCIKCNKVQYFLQFEFFEQILNTFGFRSSPLEALPTRMNHGIVSVSRVQTVTLRQLVRDLLVEMRSHTAPIALENCSLRGVLHVQSQSLVSLDVITNRGLS